MNQTTFASERLQGQGGFVLPIVLFGLVLLTTMAIAGLAASGDEHIASRAMRESAAAFYAAEAGLHETYASWTSYPAIDSLAPGDSLDLGWQTLDNGVSYRAVVHRWDNGGQPMFRVEATGRDNGAAGGKKTLSFVLTTSPGGPGEGYKLGECCESVATVRGDVSATDDGTTIDGHDEHPAGCGTGPLTGWCYDWTEAEGACSDSLYDKSAITMRDTSLFYTDGDAALDGEPVLVSDPTINDSTFSQFGELTWDDIKALADFTLGEPGEQTELIGQIYPRYTTDPETGATVCDTSHPYNWGSPDPDDPCFDYFPIILAKGNFEYEDSYGQAIVILDYDNASMTGSEFELENNSIFNGIILGKGCVEVQHDAQFHGAVFVDGWFQNDLCGVDSAFDLNQDGHMTYSQCAIDRALVNTALYEYAEPTKPGDPGDARMLMSRSFGELFQ